MPENGKSRKTSIQSLDREHLIYSWKAQEYCQPIPTHRVEGLYKWYIDFSAGLLCVNIGHGNQHVLNIMKAQMDKLCYLGTVFGAATKAKLARMISEVIPRDLDYVFYFHNDPFGTKGDSEECGRCISEVLKTRIVLDGAHTVAAILLEPIVGKNGIMSLPKSYVQGLCQLCDENGILIISDEVMACWGHSVQWFGIENFDVMPDMITTAEGLTTFIKWNFILLLLPLCIDQERLDESLAIIDKALEYTDGLV